MHTQLSLVKTMALACGAALLTMGVVLALIGAPGAVQAAPSASIQSMIDAAPNGGTVNIPSGTYTESLTVNKTLTLTSMSSTTTIIQAASGQRVITVTSGHDLRLENLTITGGHPTSSAGGGVYVEGGNLQIADCRITNNSAEWGGGLFQEGSSGRVDVTGSRIELNTSGSQGGGMFVRGSAALTDALVLSNTAGLYGGGLHVDSGRADLNGGLFSNNRALGDNGGAVNVNNSITITGTQFISNSANDKGGALLQWNAGYTVTVTNARFERNTAKNEGGGAFISGTLALNNSTFVTNTVDSGNTTNTYGGGVYAGSTSQILASTFVSNSARCTGCSSMCGGGFYTVRPATIQGSTFEKNYAWLGGGVYGSYAAITATSSTFRNNSAGYGAAIAAYTIQATGSDFLSNRAVNQGGALQAQVITLSKTRFISNTAGAPGGAIRAGGNASIDNTLFVGNQSSWGAAVMSLENNATRVLRHVTIAHPALGNNPAVQVSSGTLELTNTIIASYTVGISQTGGILSADYDLFFTATPTQTSGGTVNWGAHNLNANPRFVSPATDNYHLAEGSPAIDAGTNAGVTTDLDSVIRPQRSGYDIGAYETPLLFGSCYARLVSNSTTYTSTDASAVQNAVNAAVPGDTVKVAGTCAGVQTRDGNIQTLYISKSLTLRGGYTTANWITSDPIASPTVLDAQQAGRVVYLMGNSGANIMLENLIIRGGYTSGTGGGVYVYTGTATLSGGQILSNTAYTGGGVYIGAGSVVTVSGMQISRNTALGGGGIYAWTGGMAIVSGSQFFSNTATNGDGGGIFVYFGGAATVSGTSILSGTSNLGSGGITNAGILTVTNSMVSGNAGLYGGIENVQTLTLTNSTLSGNQMMGSSSGGGAIEQHQVGSAPSATILNCTIVSNTASITNHSGIWLQAGTLNIGNSIVAQNGVTNNVKIDGGTFTSLGYNLTNSGAGTPFTATTDLVNTDPLLGPLQDHGGSSWTHALLPGSPAMDRIPNGVNGCGINLTNDQRGYARPAPTNGSCDIGAYEVQFTCRARIGTGVMFDSGDAAAVQNAVDAAPSGDIVRVAGTCAGVQFRAGAWQTVYITKPLILRGGYSSMNWTASDPVATPTILDARSGGYVVVLTGGTSLLQDLFMRNSPAFDKQAADRLAVSSGSAAVTPSITLENLTLRGGSMGGVLSNNADVTLSGMQIVSNTAHSGGGVNMSLSVITVTNSTVSKNMADGWGGGISNYRSRLTLVNSTISGNQSGGLTSIDGGGALDLYGTPDVTIVNSTIVNNTAVLTNAARSGIWLENGTLNIQNSVIAGNGVTNNVKIESSATFTSQGYNLTNSSVGTPFTATTDLINTNPLLGPLHNNGGSSWTHALLPGSPALNQIPNGVNGCGTTIITDQRGWPRPFPLGGKCDIGAFEAVFKVYLPLVLK